MCAAISSPAQADQVADYHAGASSFAELGSSLPLNGGAQAVRRLLYLSRGSRRLTPNWWM